MVERMVDVLSYIWNLHNPKYSQRLHRPSVKMVPESQSIILVSYPTSLLHLLVLKVLPLLLPVKEILLQ